MVPNPNDWCPYKKGKSWRHTLTHTHTDHQMKINKTVDDLSQAME